MLIKVEPGKKYSFDISQNQRIAQGEYDCILEASGPFGSLFSEKRHCLTLDEPTGQNKKDRNLNADEKSRRDVKESSKIWDSEYKVQSQNEPIDETCAQIGNSAARSTERDSEISNGADSAKVSISAKNASVRSKDKSSRDVLHTDASKNVNTEQMG